MGIETQVLDFIFNLNVRPFSKSADSLIDTMKKLEVKAGSVFSEKQAKIMNAGLLKATSVTQAALKGTVRVLETSFKWWSQHNLAMLDYQKQAGLTKAEIADFSSEVISSAAKYGIALNRVSTMATFLSEGLGRSRKEAARLSGSMSDLMDVTRMSKETAQELSHVYFRQFTSSATESTKLIHGLAEQARVGHVSMESLGQIILSNSDALRSMPIKQATRDLGALATSMMEQGATVEQTLDAISRFGDVNSQIYKTFVASGSDVAKTVDFIAGKVKFLQEQQKLGAISHTQYEVNLFKLANTFGLNRFQMEKLAAAQDGLTSKMQAFDSVQAKSLAELQAANDTRLNVFDRFNKRLSASVSGMAKFWEGLYGPNSAIWGYADKALEKIEDVAIAIDRFVQRFRATLSEGASMWYNFLSGIQMSDLTDPFKSKELSEANGSSYRKASTPEAKVTYFRRQFETSAHRMEAMGLDKDTVERFRRERAEDVRKIAADLGVKDFDLGSLATVAPQAPATEKVGPSRAGGKEDATFKALELIAAHMGEFVRLQRNQATDRSIERNRSGSSRKGRNNAEAASNVVIGN